MQLYHDWRYSGSKLALLKISRTLSTDQTTTTYLQNSKRCTDGHQESCIINRWELHIHPLAVIVFCQLRLMDVKCGTSCRVCIAFAPNKTYSHWESNMKPTHCRQLHLEVHTQHLNEHWEFIAGKQVHRWWATQLDVISCQIEWESEQPPGLHAHR